MTFDYFLDTMKIVIEFTILHTREGMEKHNTERRAAIAAGNEELYQKLILKTANWEQLTSQLVQANLYQQLKVPKPVFEKSMQVYMMEPEKRTIYEEEIQKLRDSLRTRTQQKLTRDQCISSVKLLEQFKLDAQMKMYDIVRSQKLAPPMINAIIKVEKLKADDIFFNQTGFEEEDVEPSIKELGLEEDPELKAIIDEFSKKSAEFLDAKKDETAKMIQLAKDIQEAAKKKKEEEVAEKAKPSTPAELLGMETSAAALF